MIQLENEMTEIHVTTSTGSTAFLMTREIQYQMALDYIRSLVEQNIEFKVWYD